MGEAREPISLGAVEGLNNRLKARIRNRYGLPPLTGHKDYALS